MLGREGELKSAGGLLGQPSSGFPRDMRGMIVEIKWIAVWAG